MSRRPSLKSRWKARLFTTGLVSGTVKVTLFALYEDMHEDGYVSVPMARMAERLQRHERKILQHYADAVDVGLLARVSRGYEGHTAVYRAMLPVPERVPKSGTLSVSEIGTLSPRKRVPILSTPVLRRPGLYAYVVRSERRAVKPAATAAVLFASLPALQAATGTRPETNGKRRGAGAMSTPGDQDRRKDQPA